MQDQVRQRLGLIGLQRTGTNYVQQVLKAAVPGADFTDHLAWKHAFRDEAGDAPIGDKVVIVSRHPVLWLQSCLLNSSKDIKINRSEFFADGVDPIIGFANLYTRFYGGWLEHKRTAGGYLLRYEDVLERGSEAVKEKLSGNYTVLDISHQMMTLPQSVQLSPDDLKAVISRESAVAKDVATKFWDHLHPAVSADLGYTLEEINFSEAYAVRQKLRSAAYKLTEQPKALTDEEFDLLVREGKDNFRDDGLVLGQIGTRLMNGGDVEGALDWLSHAVLAIQRNDDQVFGRELDSRLADYLELLSKASLTIRERKLERLLRHYTRVNPKEDHYRAGKEWNLSLCWTKLGKLDLAIEHASRAVEFADLAPTRKGDVVWWNSPFGRSPHQGWKTVRGDREVSRGGQARSFGFPASLPPGARIPPPEGSRADVRVAQRGHSAESQRAGHRRVQGDGAAGLRSRQCGNPSLGPAVGGAEAE